MYRRILVAVENSAADRTILDHVRQLAALTDAEILLVHVADGWAARHFNDLQLRESEEIKADRSVPGQPPLLSAIADGTFGLMKRPADKGRGLDGVATKAADYYNPATEILEADQR